MAEHLSSLGNIDLELSTSTASGDTTIEAETYKTVVIATISITSNETPEVADNYADGQPEEEWHIS